MKTKLIFLYFVFLRFYNPVIFSQTNLKETIALLSWSVGSCDSRYNSTSLLTRISSIRIENEKLYISISFKDNCCATFYPKVDFRNDTLLILPYEKHPDSYCSCDCCFSFDFIIEGMSDTSFTTLYQGKKIVYSLDPYPVIPISFIMYNRDTVNRTNRYGAPVGKWISFYYDDKIQEIKMYDTSFYDVNKRPIWTKSFYENGQPHSFKSKDVNMYWNESGVLKSITYFSPSLDVYRWEWDEKGVLINKPESWILQVPN